MKSEYTIENHPLGVIVRGAMPIDDLVALGTVWGKQGYDLMDALLAQKLDVCVVVTNRKNQRIWREQLGLKIESDSQV